MAISRVPGYSLLANLDRQGTDFYISSNGQTLFYWDVNNYRIGINNSAPQYELDVSGNIITSNGHVYTGANLSYDIGSQSNQWRNLFVGNVNTNNLTVGGTLVIGGNITISGNTTGGIIYADEIYDSNHRVLTTNTTFTVTGDISGSGFYSNVILTLPNLGVSSGLYGSTEYIPQIIVNNKGQTTFASNITLTKLGNVYANNTTLYTTFGNLTLNSNDGYILASNNIIANLANPVNSQDAVTLSYLTAAIFAAGSEIAANNSSVKINDNGISPGVVTTTVDGVIVSNVDINSADFYVGVNVGTINISGNTISSTGNIIVETQYPGIVKLYGNTAMQIPAGDDYSRPNDPVEGYIRYSTSRNGIEYWDGVAWQIPGEFTIVSDTITPDGVSNVFILTANTSTQGVLVNINGTVQQPYTSYIVTNNAIQFTEVPLTTDIIEVRTLAAGAALTVDTLGYNNSLIVADGINLNVTGNLIPSANVTYSLGSADHQWKDLWVSSNTVYIGGASLSVVNGTLSLNGNSVMPVPYGNINVAAYLGGSFSVGTITAGIWNGGTIGVAYGGTGGTTPTEALTSLLPSGASTGYVLTTGGSGSYYWASAGGGGGATVGQTINTLRQSNVATQGQTEFTLTGNISYTPGSGQLGVYINGVRQFPTEYTETASNVFTLTTGVNDGDVVFAEINKSQSFNNYANLTYASNIGNISASGLTVQAAIESLENNKAPLSNPVFTGNVVATNITGTLLTASQPYITALGTISSGTWNGGTIGVSYGGTGATTATGALTNLLPGGASTGYVLTTGGTGSYYWAVPAGGGGSTVGQSLTTLRQSNAIVSNTTVIGLSGISYTPGAGQLRVYVNGVRQFPSAYTETSNVSYTLSANVVSGDTVFTEIDAFSSFNNYANLTYASNVGNIAASRLTVQAAIESLENNKAPLASPVFTGVTTVGGNLVVQGNLFVNGNLTTINANNLSISDSLIYLADDNPADTLDIGIVSSFTSAVRYQHTGFVRDATDGVWKLFANVVAEPTTTIDFTNATYSNLQLGNLTAVNGVFTGNITANVSGYSIGYRDLPQITASNVTLALTDAGKHFYANTGSPTTITIPTNANVAFPIGTTIVIVNRGIGNISISNQGIGSGPILYLSGNATTTTSRTLTQYGMATLLKAETDLWFVNGTGVV